MTIPQRLAVVFAASLLLWVVLIMGTIHTVAFMTEGHPCDPTVYVDGSPAPCLTQEQDKALRASEGN
jgi:hypothetical protein